VKASAGAVSISQIVVHVTPPFDSYEAVGVQVIC
jgi:hypothetical protein